MSQLFDYFVCSRPLIDEWVEALEQGDEELQAKVEGRMPRMRTLKNLGNDELAILASCTEAGDPDVVEAVGNIDLIRAICEEDGPWIMTFRRGSIEAVTKMTVNENLLERWVEAVVDFNGGDEEYYRHFLTADTAQSLRELCQHANDHNLELFVCFYG